MSKLNKNLESKLERLKNILKSLRSVIVAYSGGVDSSLLLKISLEILGEENVLALTDFSPLYPKGEIQITQRIANSLGAQHLVIQTNPLDNEEFIKNTKNRCYICKKNLFKKLLKIKEEKKFCHVIEATHKDDLYDYRMGILALKELNIKSPLLEAGLRKKEIRKIAKVLGLENYNKSQAACLASRIPPYQKITKRKLKMIGEAEEFLKNLGLSQVRVRHHTGELARIEIQKNQIDKFLKKEIQEKVIKKLKEIGYKHVSLDLEGYKQGGGFY